VGIYDGKDSKHELQVQPSNGSMDSTKKKYFRHDLGDILTLNSPFNRVRPAPLPQESMKTLDFVKRRDNILGSLNESKYDVLIA